MKKHVKILSLLLALLMLSAPLVACNDQGDTESSETKSQDTEISSTTESASEEASESEESHATESESKEPETQESESETVTVIEAVENEYTDIIKLSNDLKNGVNPYFTDSTRNELTIENKTMSLGYNMTGNMQVSHLSNTKGVPYITNTMDVILNLENGNRYYASKSLDSTVFNIFRYGYYYYENRIEGQTFMNELKAEEEYVFDLSQAHRNSLSKVTFDNGTMNYYTGAGNDPQFLFNNLELGTSDYAYLEIVAKIPKITGNTEVYIVSGSHTGFSTDQRYQFLPIAGEEYQTYVIPLADNFADYTGTLKGVRFDINTPTGTPVSIKSVRLFSASYAGAPETLSLQRSFHTYSDKLHHLVQLSTTDTVSGVASVQIVTTIDESRVAAVVVKDADGLKYTLEGVDWATAEYVGFDVKDAGIFGYILPVYNEEAYKKAVHSGSGTLNVTLSDGVYTITQTKVPTGNKLIPSAQKVANTSDFYIGCRIYNDEAHNFDAFIKEAEIERNPLTSENIVVDTEFNNAKFVSYDALRGSYVFTLTGGNFNKSYYVYPNRQFRVKFTVTGDDKDRNMFFMTRMSDNGGVECAALLGEGDLLLPVPLEVCKNFGSDGDITIFDLDDAQYSEVYFPMIVNAGQTRQYTVVHAYQNWGIFPLKQISSIEYHQPFYHLSTGVTETNCIVPFPDAGPSLPDHRAMSAPFWGSQPQHTSGGGHVFLHFTNEEDKTVLSHTTGAAIDSYGPTYADVSLDYISDDNRIKASYTHLEMPQTDENRAYYEMSYTFLEDVSFKDFANDFKFYRCSDNDATGWYQKIGYLDKDNNYQVVNSVHSSSDKQKLILGDNCPYFSFFDMADREPDNSTHVGYVNISFLIYNYEIILGGEKISPNFAITNYGDYIQLSLDLGEVTFKKGDTIKINSILMPWGSQLLNDGIEDIRNGNYEYTTVLDGGEVYMDKNVRDVRENTLLDPLKATADEGCTVIDSVYLPRLRTTDAKTATFTLSGGHNNVAVRIYGFEKLTTPKIEEYVKGKWRTCKLSSASNRDDKGFGYYYDGYMVHYDEDGTYSYSFVAEMDHGAPRTFRITATEDFKSWPAATDPEYGEQITTEGDPLKVYVDASELASFSDELIGYVSSLQLMEDEDGTKFARYFANSAAVEGFITPFKSNNDAYIDLESTGQYAVFKYRLPSNIPTKLKNFQFYASTIKESPTGPEKCEFYDLKYDDQWHVIILDLSKLIPSSHFKADENGIYKAHFFRIDIFNQSGLTEEHSIDLAYVGLCDNLEEIFELNKDMDMVTLVTNTGAENIVPATGAIYNESPLNVYIPAEKIATAAAGLSLKKVSLSSDRSYVRLEAEVGSKYEAFTTLYSHSEALYQSLESTGQYVVFKYRLQSDSNVKLSGLEIFASTESATPAGPDNTDYYMLRYDDQWHVVVMDFSKMLPKYCIAEENGTYLLDFLRFDFFSANTADEIYMDFAYIGIADDLSKIYEFNKDMSEICLVTATDKEVKIDPSTGEPIKSNNTPLSLYYGPEALHKIIEKQARHFLSDLSLSKDGTYVRLNANNTKAEAYAKLFNAADEEYATLKSTGKYVVFKYRLPSSHSSYTETSIQYYAYTVDGTALGNSNRVTFNKLQYDDQWHVVVIDTTTMMSQNEFKDTDGIYKALTLRFDFINGSSLPNDYYIDYAYVGMCEDLATAYEFNKDMDAVLLVEGGDKQTLIDPKTGNAIN